MSTITAKLKSALLGFGCAVGALASSQVLAADLPSRAIAPVAPILEPAWHPFFVRAGVAGVFPDTGINTTINAAPFPPIGTIPGSFFPGSGHVSNRPAAAFEAGYYVTRHIAVSIAGGFPPTFTTTGQNGLATQGVLYRVMEGLPVAAVTYHLDNFGPIRPYAGVGVGYAIVFRNESAAVLNPLLRNKAAFVLVGGIDYDLSEHWGLFVDVKKAFLTQSFTGRTQPQPVVVPPFGFLGTVQPTVAASVRTDPVIVTAGVGYRF
ncbi:OmpW family protein [Beijerinckia sp. L45]|uniref:OmpW/AlkL family protein n=1 Tax=Beijerinckia sp. L45 TaxID=1641855 RepID=UPI00131BE820|nr:OmpW family outer membrane protein [Beijerinckia sp. L45]